MKPAIPWRRSLLLGFLGTLALGGCTPLWMLAQMGGPVPFGYLWFAIGGSALTLTTFIAKTRTINSAVVCGLAFSVPIAVFCWILPGLDPHLDYFKKEMRGEAVASVIGSILLMILATFQRQLNPRQDEKPPSKREGGSE